MDLGYIGKKYTWSNGQRGDANITERLDRFMANDYWKRAFMRIDIFNRPWYSSDHFLVIIKWGVVPKSGRSDNKIF